MEVKDVLRTKNKNFQELDEKVADITTVLYKSYFGP